MINNTQEQTMKYDLIELYRRTAACVSKIVLEVITTHQLPKKKANSVFFLIDNSTCVPNGDRLSCGRVTGNVWTAIQFCCWVARLVDTGGLSLVYIAALEILKRNKTIKNLMKFASSKWSFFFPHLMCKHHELLLPRQDTPLRGV